MRNQISTIFKGLMIIAAAAPAMALAQTQVKTSDDVLLEQRVLSEMVKNQDGSKSIHSRVVIPKGKSVDLQSISALNITQGLVVLNNFQGVAETKTPHCKDVGHTTFAGRYVLTTDAAGKSCRIYDLSFPTLKTLFSGNKIMQIPVQLHAAGEYLNWLDGNFDGINASTEQFKKSFSSRDVVEKSWLSLLKFRNAPKFVAGIPQSFRISDLDLGSNFQFDATTKTAIQNFIVNSQGLDPVASEFFMKVLNNPITMLQGIRLNWNDMDKVYDVILEGEFLPLSGPVALVEFQTQYKYAVEKIFRSVLSTGLQELARLIPVPMVSSAVEVLVTDTFEQIEMAYSYQMFLLEDTLRSSIGNSETAVIDSNTAVHSLNLLYGQRADLFSTYIMAAAQQKAFDWQNFEKIGRSARYADEKGRDIAMSKMNSKLVLEKQCQSEFLHEYFTVCSKAGEKEGIYSLISEQKIFGKSLGAPQIYNFQKPYEIALIRGGTWALSIGLRIVGLPISRTVVYNLDSVLKNYMHAGILDEAILRNNLEAQPQQSMSILSNSGSEVLKWLYIQNLNPFLSKSIDQENGQIDANRRSAVITNLL